MGLPNAPKITECEFEPEMGLRTFVRSAIAWELRFQLMQRPRLSHKIEIPHSNQLCNRFIPPSVQKTLPKIQTTLNQRKVGIEFQRNTVFSLPH